MKRWKKIALVLFGLLFVSQVPFAYRRYRLSRLRASIAEVNAAHAAAPADDPFDDYAGVFHVHSSLGGHSTGTLEEIVGASKADRLAFVIMTEHPSAFVNTSEATLRGTHEGVLFLNGNELAASDGGRVFAVPGFELPDSSLSLHDLAARASGEGRLAVLGYPEQVRDLRPEGFDAVEVYNLYTNSKRISYALLFFDGLWSYWGYADLLFTDFYERPDANLKRWDETNVAGRQRLFAVAGNDAHQNVGLSLQEQTGKKLLDLKLDPYERSFSVVRNHVLIEKGQPLDAETLLGAFRRGHSYFAFDLFGDASGFRFTADNGTDRRVMGDEIATGADGRVRLSVRSPVKCRTLFFRDGRAVREVKDSAEAELTAEGAGVYRVEVYLDQLGGLLEGKPWIVSNPIFVR
ncbi:MAG: hypothetical protein M3444_15500 [Acidobacteriota bacterium]|nr:hypothetical protein [Acidobacteriota bacterium]MDQ5835364.1 hypothetical protein [Acidobacteriota bacterium]